VFKTSFLKFCPVVRPLSFSPKTKLAGIEDLSRLTSRCFLRIQERLVFHTIFITLFTVAATVSVLGGLYYSLEKKEWESLQKNELLAHHHERLLKAANYFTNLKIETELLAQNVTVIDAMEGFSFAFKTYRKELGDNQSQKFKTGLVKQYVEDFQTEYLRSNSKASLDPYRLLDLLDETSIALQYYYIFKNENPLDKKSLLNVSYDDTTYSALHKKYHAEMRNRVEELGALDFMLVDIETGNILYSVAKNIDFTTSILKEPYAQGSLRTVYEAAQASKKPAVFFSEFTNYLPAFDANVTFVASPVYKFGKKIGVFIIELPYNMIAGILQDHEQDHNFQTHLVTPNTEPLFFQNNQTGLKDWSAFIKKLVLRAGPENLVLANGQQLWLHSDTVLMAKDPWLLLSSFEEKPFSFTIGLFPKLFAYALLFMVASLVLAIVVGIRMALSISLPIERFNQVIHLLAEEQDLSKRIYLPSDDELSDMAKALNVLLDNFQALCAEALNSEAYARSTVERLNSFADKLDERQLADEDGSFKEDISQLLESGRNLSEMSHRLQILAHNFKVSAEDQERSSGW